jgi:BirA family biotin operon repressor/biotin-[acetyl-CoA-carboxylase] ligase
MAAAVAMARAVEKETGLKPLIKWPNDLYLSGRKLAGVLTEIKPRGKALEWAVVGLGLNVSAHPPGVGATNLEEAASSPVDRLKLLDRFLNELEDLLKTNLDAEEIRREWKKRSFSLGREVEVVDGQERVRGRALDIDQEGALLVRTDKGERRIVSGDLSLVG